MLKKFIMILSIVMTTLTHASATIFTIEPTTPTTVSNVPDNGVATITYRITNKMQKTRTLTFKPIQGITQNTGGAGSCASPFTLANGESCLLTLEANGALIADTVIGGPVICKTKSASDTSPDPFLCAQPAPANTLNLTRSNTNEPVSLSVSPNPLSLIIGEGDIPLTVTNNSSHITVSNIQISDIPAFNLTITNNCTSSLPPKGSCQILLRTGLGVLPSPTKQDLTISGTNTGTLNFPLTIKIAEVRLSLSSSSLAFTMKRTGSITVTNTSGAIAGLSIAPTTSSPISISNNACTPSLAASGNCVITFTSSAATTPGTPTKINIEGTNTSLETLDVTAQAYAYITDSFKSAVTKCPISTNNNFGTCIDSGATNISIPNGIALSDNVDYAYVGLTSGELKKCVISATDGSLSSCVNSGSSVTGTFYKLVVDNTINTAYLTTPDIPHINTKVSKCDVSAVDGSLSNCMTEQTFTTPGEQNPDGVALMNDGGNRYLYIAMNDSKNLANICPINAGSYSLEGCQSKVLFNGSENPDNIALNTTAGFAYVTTDKGSLYSCTISAGGIGNCILNQSFAAIGCKYSAPIALDQTNSNAYIICSTLSTTALVTKCTISADGALSNCMEMTNNNLAFPWSIAITR